MASFGPIPSNRCSFTGKVMYSEATAKKCAKEFKATSLNGRMTAYRCMFGEHWHISHQKQGRH